VSATVRACSACLQRDMRASYWVEHGLRCHRCGALCCEHSSFRIQGHVTCLPECPVPHVTGGLFDVLRALGWEPMPKMMPGHEPYTREEYARITAMVGSAAEATEVFDEDELERHADEQCSRSTIDPDAQCPEHGCARWRCDADHPTARERAKEPKK
jgi:hypothetical protein